jgi:hypothetical protein
MPLTFSFVLLALVEALVLYLAWLGGYALALDGQIVQPEPPWLIWLQAAGFSGIVLACLFSVGLFSARQRARFRGVVLRLAIATTMGGLLAAALLSWLPPHTSVGRRRGFRRHRRLAFRVARRAGQRGVQASSAGLRRRQHGRVAGESQAPRRSARL